MLNARSILLERLMSSTPPIIYQIDLFAAKFYKQLQLQLQLQ